MKKWQTALIGLSMIFTTSCFNTNKNNVAKTYHDLVEATNDNDEVEDKYIARDIHENGRDRTEYLGAYVKYELFANENDFIVLLSRNGEKEIIGNDIEWDNWSIDQLSFPVSLYHINKSDIRAIIDDYVKNGRHAEMLLERQRIDVNKLKDSIGYKLKGVTLD